jgi:hypothetical protein
MAKKAGSELMLESGRCTVPVNVRPKTNSFGGTSSLGVVVLVIDSLEGSISASLASEETLYDLEASQAATSLDGVCLKNAFRGRN